MTLEQLLSPQVAEWLENHNKKINEGYKCTNEDFFNEFDKWFRVHESEINDYVKLNEGAFSDMFDDDDDEDETESETDDRKTEIESDETESDIEPDSVDEPESEDPDDELDVVERSPKSKHRVDNSKNSKRNIFKVVNILYDKITKEGRNMDKRTYFEFLDTSDVNDMTALFAFTNLPNADLSSWNTSNVRHMEGMFYKSTFNNDSICDWNVTSCADFKNMFFGSKFNQSLSRWKPKMITTTEIEYDEETGEKHRVEVEKRAPLPFVGAYEDEEKEMDAAFWDDKFKGVLSESRKSKYTHFMDFETFMLKEGFLNKTKNLVKKGYNKVKGLFKTIAMKVNDWYITFIENGEPVPAVSPYTTLNYISTGKVDGVNAYAPIKNNLLNNNVSETAEMMSERGYYDTISKDSVEYENFKTFVQMIEESKKFNNDDIIEEERVGFSAKSGGISGIRDIDSRKLKEYIADQMYGTPAEIGRDYLKPILIWGAPGVGKSTIPNVIISEYNSTKSSASEKKALIVAECGDMTPDGFSLPMPNHMSMQEYISARPQARKVAKELGLSDDDLESSIVTRSSDAPKMWLPCYKVDPDKKITELRKMIANGHVREFYDENGDYQIEETCDGGLIMFDEFFRADPSIFKILMQILLNRSYGGYTLGDKWGIIACSNRPNDDDEVSQSFSQSGAVVTTRFRAQYNFIPDFKDWKKWAEKYGHFDELTLAFLVSDKNSEGEYVNWHMIDPEEHLQGSVAHPTPRSWSELMKTLYVVCKRKGYSEISDIPVDELEDHVFGAIGEKIGEKYIDFIKSRKGDVINVKKIFEDASYEIPVDVSAAEVSEKIINYIEANYSKDELPKIEYLINMFNLLNKTYPKSKDNYIKQMHYDILKYLTDNLTIKANAKYLKEYYKLCNDRYQIDED